ncbi:MAG: SMP-30/gluconolactonase/LRE family protein [Planctomycetota bacterium]|jgi:gluconolactonase
MSTHVDILADGLAFPEGPVFDHDGNLWCVELQGGDLACYHDGQITRFATGGNPNGAAVDANGRIWFCDSGDDVHAVRRFDPSTGQFETLCETASGRRISKPNDLAFDSVGNCVFTCPQYTEDQPPSFVCCLRPTGEATVIAEPFKFSNGLAFTDKDQTLIVAETQTDRLWKGRWDATACKWLDPAPWGDVEPHTGPGGPDGMAFGADGLLYVAVYGSSQIRAVDADGKVVKTFDLPDQNPTNCAFDPAGEFGLVVTGAETGLLLSLPDLGPGVPLYDGGDAWE